MSGTKTHQPVMPSSPVVWTDTGEMRIEWRQFLTLLWNRTGGSTGGATAPLNSPHFTGVPTAPTAAPGSNSTQLATTAYADNLDAILWG